MLNLPRELTNRLHGNSVCESLMKRLPFMILLGEGSPVIGNESGQARNNKTQNTFLSTNVYYKSESRTRITGITGIGITEVSIPEAVKASP